jgi:hypothetical protein
MSPSLVSRILCIRWVWRIGSQITGIMSEDRNIGTVITLNIDWYQLVTYPLVSNEILE